MPAGRRPWRPSPELVVIVATIIGIWGPLWPTAPTFYPETPSAELPLELSFKVKNRSALFPLRNLQIVCMLVSARSQTNKSFAETGVTLSQPVVDLAPGQSEPYSCPLHVAVDLREGDKIVRAKIDFISQYDLRWPWGGRSKSEFGGFHVEHLAAAVAGRRQRCFHHCFSLID